jgi:hypothetical protein
MHRPKMYENESYVVLEKNKSVRIIYLHNAGGVISSRVLLLCIPKGTSLVGRGDHILTNTHYLKNHQY